MGLVCDWSIERQKRRASYRVGIKHKKPFSFLVLAGARHQDATLPPHSIRHTKC